MTDQYLALLLNPTSVLMLAGFLWMFWALFVFTMGIYRAVLADRLKGLNYVLALPIVVVAITVDVLANLVIAPIVFLDVPREFLVTSRLVRYMAGPSGWRRTIAAFICDNMLDIFDPTGNHC
jgi:hypothetical protein